MKKLKIAAFLYLFLKLCSPSFANVAWEKVNLPKPYITSVQNTHFGVVAGEFDSRSFLNPYNGVSLTKNFGDSWQDIGLAKRGVTDIFYHKEDRSLFATTYYSVFDGTVGRNTIGLYVSYDVGKTWQHLGPDVSATKVIAFDNNIILGTYSHGLWYSNDNGSTWIQKLGSGYFGPRIKLIKQVGTAVYAYDDLKTYKSIDNGSSWEVFAPFGDEKIADVEGTTDIIFAGTSNNRGLLYSNDGGSTWTRDIFWNDKSVHSIKYFPISKAFYLGTSIGVWLTYDNGKTWQNTQAPFSKQTLGISWVFSNNSKLFASVQQEGLYKYNTPSHVNDIKPYFAFPWKQTYPNETLDSVSAFFDHAYPLLGYSLYSEPSSDSATTTNFYGLSLPVPDLYYSSHDGTDFALKYGTEVRAVANGSASYGYNKSGLGYFTKLNHQNGYQTVYGHLQPHPDQAPSDVV
jgi:murein DD-endopeptidase MepM/ murein hydrolase activator NlpD